MNSQSFLVKVVAGGSDSSRVWNAKKPMMVGHPMRWMISQEAGGVRIKNLDAPKAAAHFVKNAELAKTASVVLVPAAKGAKDSGFSVELRPVVSASAAYAADTTAVGTNALRIFFCKGEWAIDAIELQGSYVAKADGKKVFKLKGTDTGYFTGGDSIEIRVLVDGLKLDSENLAKGSTRTVRFSEADERVLSFAGSEWRLKAFAKSRDAQPFMAPMAADSESKLFNKTLRGALVATILAGLVSFLIPKAEVKKEETVRILLAAKKKPKAGMMTAAPQGDKDARDFSIGKSGSEKNAGRKGSKLAADTKKATTAGKESKKLAKSTKSKVATPKMAKTSPKKSNPAPKKASVASAKKSPAKAPIRGAPAKKAVAASRPTVAPRSALFQTLSSSSLQRAARGLVAGGGSYNSNGSSADNAREMATGGGTGSGSLGGAGGVSTRSASVSGFGGGRGDGDGGPGSRGAGYGRGSHAKVSGQGRSFVSMDTGASEVDEGLTREQIGRVIHAHRDEIRYCHESAMLRSPGAEGKLDARFSIGASGTVQRTAAGGSTVGDRRLHDCILARLKGWKFPKPKGGVTVAVKYPFVLKAITR